MLSHWEKLTAGLCNGGFKDKPKRAQTAREAKRRLGLENTAAKSSTVKAKFKRIDAQRKGGAAAKELRRNSDQWDNRVCTNVKGFWIKGNV